MKLQRTKMEGRNSLSLYSLRHWNSINHIGASLTIDYDEPWSLSVSLNKSICYRPKKHR